MYRLYRLPGDRALWRVDSGRGTQVFFVNAFYSHVAGMHDMQSPQQNPRAWVAVPAKHLFVVDGKAYFADDPKQVFPAYPQPSSCNEKEPNDAHSAT